MFKANSSTSFKTDKPKTEVFKVIEENLETLGSVEISDNGVIKINASKNSSFSHDCMIDGKVREKDGKYSIDIDVEAKPTVVLWVLALCGIGLIMLILPYMAKGELSKKADRALDNIRMEFK
jgi:hypothetical protein